MRARWLPGRRIEPSSDTGGSVTVEASLIMPVFLMTFILLIAIIRMAMTQMALQDAAAQTARLTAAHMYPIQQVLQSKSGAPSSRSEGQSSESRPASSGLGLLAGELAGNLPEPAGPLLEAALRGDWNAAADIAAAPIGEAVFGPLIRELAAESALDPDRIRVTRLSLPDFSKSGEEYFRVRLAYDFPLALPFTGSHVTLSADAEERVWVADPAPAPTHPEDGDGSDRVVIVSIEPSPLRPGRKAKLTAIGKPNAKLNLEVWYKSGKSKAKNLGEKTADEHGIVTWEWHVSGNTTPGVWELEVTSEDGAKAHSFFIVQKAGSAGE
ncbi:Putative uncharacterized protein [Thermobacillus xylanilyticus]|uniref:TadE-like domain-containing protein n=1 Tax=Thermobacillus xylanilyticus TaxID=76633 RepID=A0ABN7SC53_THEXY|nr:TadE family protein [Thermobacillus xylanilyticus]REJ12216.1 MAG: hypothetical protein C6W59_14525 [Paenibacillaceae bacterium]CAG5092575.1 Putative uncharacterized protein [Thermobacillus xylanilyticus]